MSATIQGVSVSLRMNRTLENGNLILKPVPHDFHTDYAVGEVMLTCDKEKYLRGMILLVLEDSCVPGPDALEDGVEGNQAKDWFRCHMSDVVGELT